VAGAIHIALFTTGYPYVDAVVRAVELARRHDATFSRSIGEPFAPRRDDFARSFLDSNASHALLLEGDVVPPEDALDRLLRVRAPVATALYPQWLDDRLVTNVQTATDAHWSAAVPARVFSVRRCLLGCVLVQREVFTKMSAPWFLSTMTGERFLADDEWFCSRVREAGMGIRCDGGTVCASLRHGTDLRALAGDRLHTA
jgi:hypothetical protein